MADEKENWVSVREAVRRHNVPRRTLYGFVERQALKSKTIDGVLHLSEDDLLRVLAARAAGTSAAQTKDHDTANGTATSGARDPALADARRRLEDKRIAAREAEAEAELQRNRQALVDAEAERQARARQTETAARRDQLALEQERWDWEQKRAAEEQEARHEEAKRQQELRHRERQFRAEQERARWMAAWMEAVTIWVHENAPGRGDYARAIANIVLSDFVPESDPDVVADALRDALEARCHRSLAAAGR